MKIQKTIRELLIDWLNKYIDEYGNQGVIKVTTSLIDDQAIDYVKANREKHSVVRSTVTRVWRGIVSKSNFNTQTHRFVVEGKFTDSGRRLWIITRSNR